MTREKAVLFLNEVLGIPQSKSTADKRAALGEFAEPEGYWDRRPLYSEQGLRAYAAKYFRRTAPLPTTSEAAESILPVPPPPPTPERSQPPASPQPDPPPSPPQPQRMQGPPKPREALDELPGKHVPPQPEPAPPPARPKIRCRPEAQRLQPVRARRPQHRQRSEEVSA
jgi:hypothetical protein